MDWRRWVLVGAMVLGGLPGAAWAESEVDILLNKLVEKNILTNVEAGLIRREISETKEQRTKQMAKDVVPKWVQSVAISGDVRLRQENFFSDAAPPTRSRQRIRMRLGVKAKVSDQLEVGTRLATGTNLDPVSTNQSMQDSFDKKDLFIDLAYVKFTSAGLGFMEEAPITVWGGKFENPFYVTPMLFDGDLTPEGFAASIAPKLGPVEAFITGGIFPIDELSGDANDPTFYGAQTGATVWANKDAEEEWLKNLNFKGGVGYYDFAHLENGIDVFTSGSTFGNSGTASGNTAFLRDDFNVLDLLGEINSQVAGIPLKLYADYAKNTAIADNDEGFHAGVKVGKADKPWAWEAGYFYQKLEPNAVVGLFADSDFGNGGTNRSGHVYQAALGVPVVKNSTLGFKMFVTEEITGPDAAIDRLQVDWVTKF